MPCNSVTNKPARSGELDLLRLVREVAASCHALHAIFIFLARTEARAQSNCQQEVAHPLSFASNITLEGQRALRVLWLALRTRCPRGDNPAQDGGSVNSSTKVAGSAPHGLFGELFSLNNLSIKCNATSASNLRPPAPAQAFHTAQADTSSHPAGPLQACTYVHTGWLAAHPRVSCRTHHSRSRTSSFLLMRKSRCWNCPFLCLLDIEQPSCV